MMPNGQTLIACIALVGGGFLSHLHPELRDSIFPAITLVLGYFFGKNGAAKA